MRHIPQNPAIPDILTHFAWRSRRARRDARDVASALGRERAGARVAISRADRDVLLASGLELITFKGALRIGHGGRPIPSLLPIEVMEGDETSEALVLSWRHERGCLIEYTMAGEVIVSSPGLLGDTDTLAIHEAYACSGATECMCTRIGHDGRVEMAISPALLSALKPKHQGARAPHRPA